MVMPSSPRLWRAAQPLDKNVLPQAEGGCVIVGDGGESLGWDMLSGVLENLRHAAGGSLEKLGATEGADSVVLAAGDFLGLFEKLGVVEGVGSSVCCVVLHLQCLLPGVLSFGQLGDRL